MNNNARVFWIAWCCVWALFWLIIGFFTFGLGWFGTGLSLLAILIPVGVSAQLHLPPAPYYPPQFPPGDGVQLPPQGYSSRRPGLRAAAPGYAQRPPHGYPQLPPSGCNQRG